MAAAIIQGMREQELRKYTETKRAWEAEQDGRVSHRLTSNGQVGRGTNSKLPKERSSVAANILDPALRYGHSVGTHTHSPPQEDMGYLKTDLITDESRGRFNEMVRVTEDTRAAGRDSRSAFRRGEKVRLESQRFWAEWDGAMSKSSWK